MYMYSVMPILKGYEKEECADIFAQYENGTADMVLFSMRLVPDGKEPGRKADKWCEKYKSISSELKKAGKRCGILAQSTLGHGYRLSYGIPFEKYVNLTDGKEENICCPLDERFLDYLKETMKKLASLEPEVIMIDDDFRMMMRPGKGCACRRHLEEFEKLAGKAVTREEIFAHTQKESDDDVKYTRLFIETQRAALIKAAKAIREGIDSVDSSIRGVICSSNTEFIEDTARIICGEGNKRTVRISNGRYAESSLHGFSDVMLYAAIQKEVMKDKADIFLDESDTCPQNRYSTSCAALHAHITASVLQGVGGAKLWLTRMEAYEPDSGAAYRSILSKNRPFYEALEKIAPEIRYFGCRIPIYKDSNYILNIYRKENVFERDYCGWSAQVLERLGLPVYFSSEPGGVAFMDGNMDAYFSDDEIEQMLCGTVCMSADTAKSLIRRGFGEYLGVAVREWQGDTAMGEIIKDNGKRCELQKDSNELIPLFDNVEIGSAAYFDDDMGEFKELYPTSTVFKNPKGGECIVFSGKVRTEFNYMDAFSFLNESRKLQLVNILKRYGELPLCYAGDAEIFLTAGRLKGGSIIAAVFNLGSDSMDFLSLTVENKFDKIQILMPDGGFRECEYERNGKEVSVKVPLKTLEPAVIILSQEDINENN